MQVWIDQDCCTGAGLCVDHCPDLFVVLEDGIGYVRLDDVVFNQSEQSRFHVPRRLEREAVDAAERCPGECIYLEADPAPASVADDTAIVDAELATGSD